ncbi:hypothetical protein D3C87_1802940 [compost metagenome]
MTGSSAKRCSRRAGLVREIDGLTNGVSAVTQPLKRLVLYWYQFGLLNTGMTGRFSATMRCALFIASFCLAGSAVWVNSVRSASTSELNQRCAVKRVLPLSEALKARL